MLSLMVVDTRMSRHKPAAFTSNQLVRVINNDKKEYIDALWSLMKARQCTASASAAADARKLGCSWRPSDSVTVSNSWG